MSVFANVNFTFSYQICASYRSSRPPAQPITFTSPVVGQEPNCVFLGGWAAIMDLEKRFRLISVQILLLATLAIQGLAPDLYNLATLRNLYVLCRVPVPLQFFEHNADEDEDSVCGTIEIASSAESFEVLERSSRLEFVSSSERTRLGAASEFPARDAAKLCAFGQTAPRRVLSLDLLKAPPSAVDQATRSLFARAVSLRPPRPCPQSNRSASRRRELARLSMCHPQRAPVRLSRREYRAR